MITPTRISLVSQTIEALREGMGAGRWQRLLPGERALIQELHVSRWTVRLALAQLARQGFVAVAHGHRCRILAKARKGGRTGPTPLRVVLLAPNPLSMSRAFTVLLVDELRTLLHARGMTLSVVNASRPFQKTPGVALEALVETHPRSAWILSLSTAAIQQWFQDRGLPTVVSGSAHSGITLPCIDIDFFAAGVHAGHTLLGARHRRLAFLEPASIAGGIIAFEAGLRSALARGKLDPTGLTVTRLREGKAEVCIAIDRLLKERPAPTALVFSRSHAALTALTHLYRLGVRVPEDASLLSMEWEPFLSETVPSIACYKVPADQFAQRLVRILMQRLETASQTKPVLIQPQFIPGSVLVRGAAAARRLLR